MPLLVERQSYYHLVRPVHSVSPCLYRVGVSHGGRRLDAPFSSCQSVRGWCMLYISSRPSRIPGRFLLSSTLLSSQRTFGESKRSQHHSTHAQSCHHRHLCSYRCQTHWTLLQYNHPWATRCVRGRGIALHHQRIDVVGQTHRIPDRLWSRYRLGVPTPKYVHRECCAHKLTWCD